ncbi:MAG: hypothetical protein LWY06_13880 [Firmicutes bacterium]|nr:hypothetical protein [Bacillota bacterium]
MNRHQIFTLSGKALCLILFFAAFLSQANAAPAIKGNIQYVEGSRFGIGEGFNFEFDKKGNPGVCYYDRNLGSLKYAKVERGRWEVETVAPAGFRQTGLSSSLVYDDANNPCICFSGHDETLKYAVKRNGSWTIEQPDTASGAGGYCSLALKPGGEPVISYQAKDGLYIAKKLAGVWTKEKIDSNGGKTCLLINSTGSIQVYYMGKTAATAEKPASKKEKPVPGVPSQWILKRAFNDDKGWKISTVPGSIGCSGFDAQTGEKESTLTAFIVDRDRHIVILREALAGSGIWKQEQISVDNCENLSLSSVKNGFPSIVFTDSKSSELKIAKFNGAKWDEKLVASAQKGYEFRECQSAKDAKGRDFIILYDGDSLNVLVEKGEGWGLGRIDGKSQVGGYINLAIDNNGTPVMCYYDYSRKELRSARKEGGVWRVTVVDNTGDVGKFASLAAGTGTDMHVSYYDATKGDLKYAIYKDGKWKWDRVDYTGDTGLNSSITTDKAGNPHIVFKDKTKSVLKYATRSGIKWKTSVISKLGEYGDGCVILAAPDDQIKVVFVDGNKIANPPAGESPVRTFVRMATLGKDGKWTIEELAGPYAASIDQNGLSADVSKTGDYAVSYFDRDGHLTVLRTENGTWHMERFGDLCWDITSTRFQKDGSLKILFLSGKLKEDTALRLASFEKGKWKLSDIEINEKKIRYISLASSPDSLIRFALGDLFNHTASYFEQRQK